MKHYFTFGQNHTHRVAGVTLDCDSVVEIEADDPDAARDKMWEAFGAKWAMQYEEGRITMDYYPRGVVLRMKA